MKSIDKIKTHKIIRKIESGDFDGNDVDNLFMRLRAYSNGCLIFREVADFVAHNNERNRGMINDSLKGFYLRMKFFIEYSDTNKKLDIAKPFSRWIKDLIIYQIRMTEEAVLISKYKVTKDRLITRVKKGFKDNKNGNYTHLVEGKLSLNTLKAIQFVMNYLYVKEVYNQSTLLNEIIKVIQKNNLEIDLEKLMNQSDCFTVHTMLLMHNTQFNISSKRKGYCYITSENLEISHNTTHVDKSGNIIDYKESFGNLLINGTIFIEREGKDLGISHTIMTTNLSAENFCEKEMFVIEAQNVGQSTYFFKRLKFNKDIVISDSCKLCNYK